jgi:hypothetical protein
MEQHIEGISPLYHESFYLPKPYATENIEVLTQNQVLVALGMWSFP